MGYPLRPPQNSLSNPVDQFNSMSDGDDSTPESEVHRSAVGPPF